MRCSGVNDALPWAALCRNRGFRYEWDEADSSFSCSNATLMKVWELNKYTVMAGLLETFTDSNTRERKPYEVSQTATSALCGIVVFA